MSPALRHLTSVTDTQNYSQSALTDFLASHNISAQQIHTDYQRRLREAQEQAGPSPSNDQGEDKENELDLEEDENGETIEERKKRKRKEEKALVKIKQSKEFKRRKSEQKRDYSDDESDDAIARSMLTKAQPLPGQLENCEICEKRFTVTPYSKTGPDGGLLCTPCSKELANEEKKSQPKKKRGAPKGKRRQTESDRMMGNVKPGSKSLLETCVVVSCIRATKIFATQLTRPSELRMWYTILKNLEICHSTFSIA